MKSFYSTAYLLMIRLAVNVYLVKLHKADLKQSGCYMAGEFTRCIQPKTDTSFFNIVLDSKPICYIGSNHIRRQINLLAQGLRSRSPEGLERCKSWLYFCKTVVLGCTIYLCEKIYP